MIYSSRFPLHEISLFDSANFFASAFVTDRWARTVFYSTFLYIRYTDVREEGNLNPYFSQVIPSCIIHLTLCRQIKAWISQKGNNCCRKMTSTPSFYGFHKRKTCVEIQSNKKGAKGYYYTLISSFTIPLFYILYLFRHSEFLKSLKFHFSFVCGF